MSSKAFALKFISGKYQGGEFPLRPGKEVVIGRSSDLDMVLVEDMVSRKHARIVATDDGVTINDLGSTNGTFVNGEKVKEAQLKEGDRILVGTSILKLVVQQAGSPTLDDKQIRDHMEQVAARPKASGAMTGRIDEVPIPDLLQLFQTSRKTGVLVVSSQGREAKVYLRAGKVYYAVIDGDHDLGPEKSFYRLVSWDTGSFELRPPEEQEFLVELEDSTEALLMEGMRQLDEMRRVEKDLPVRTANVALSVPMTAALRDLKPELLDVLQLVMNHGTVGSVLDVSPASDAETAAALVELLKADYVRAH